MLRLVTGGSGSGKSRYAEDLILSFGPRKRYYIATMMPWDGECRRRIERHRRMRAEKGFETVEQYLDLETLSLEPGAAVLLGCLSNLAANEYFRETRPDSSSDAGLSWKSQVETRLAEGIFRLETQAAELVVVTNEIFSDGAAYDGETMNYMEVLGRTNARLAARAGQVTEVVYGIPIHHRLPETGAPLLSGGGKNAGNPTKKEEQVL